MGGEASPAATVRVNPSASRSAASKAGEHGGSAAPVDNGRAVASSHRSGGPKVPFLPPPPSSSIRCGRPGYLGVMNRRFPWGLLLIAFIAIPILEIYVIIQVGQVIGAWWTIAILIADSIFGSWLLRREGRRSWHALQVALAEGRMPTKELADGILIVVGGTLMISPGFVTDAFGMLAILPFTRPVARGLLTGFLSRRLFVTALRRPGNAQRPGPAGDVVQGEVIDPQ